jgi:superfamily II DNA or RNA helicase
VIRASAADVRARIADALLGDEVVTQVGEISLHAHQTDGVARVRRLLDEHGGALLADDVGLGKTYIALAVARDARAPLVIAPAALRESWQAAAQRAAVAIRFVSVELLSRGVPVSGAHDLVIVDEAQHLRTRDTRRFTLAAAACRTARVLLVSATPVQNRLDDLRTIVSLFLGERANAMTAEELAVLVVRRSETDVDGASLGLPRVVTPEWICVTDDADCLDRLLQLPPPVPAIGEGDAGVLVQYTLARQWASSRAALRGALTRRLARGRAMEDALLAGRMPTRHELAAWALSENAQQLSFPDLVVAAPATDAEALLTQLRAHSAGVRDLLAWLDTTRDPDIDRAHALATLLERHGRERVIAFSEYRDTVQALYRALAPAGRVAMLTNHGGRIVSGRMSRSEVLSLFAPGASARAPAGARIDLLLTTDVLSEGVNLQDASVVVHLDLAWNPARLQQRVGRVRRVDAARDTVRVYFFAPPAPAERLLQLEQRLRVKLDDAAHAVGVAGAILPGLPVATTSVTSHVEQIAARLRGWRCATVARVPVVAAVAATQPAALVCIRQNDSARLLAVRGDVVTADREAIQSLVAAADAPERDCELVDVGRVERRVLQHLRAHDVTHVIDLPSLRAGRARRDVLHRVDSIACRAPRHVRPRLSPLMHAARAVATGALSAGAERVLATLADALMPDEAWLHAVGEFAALHARPAAREDAEVLAVLLFVPPAAPYLPATSSSRV